MNISIQEKTVSPFTMLCFLFLIMNMLNMFLRQLGFYIFVVVVVVVLSAKANRSELAGERH